MSAKSAGVSGSGARWRGSSAGRQALAALVLLGLAALLGSSERRVSPVVDEPIHLTRGLSYWWTGDTILSYAHPPLANALQGLGAVAGREAQDLTRLPSWPRAHAHRLAHEYFMHDYATARAQLRAARRVTMGMTLLLALSLYLFCLRRWGWPTAMVALTLCAASPTLIAHGRLVTTDAPLALATVLLVAALVRYLERPGVLGLALLTIAGGIAVTVKHTGLGLVAICGLLTILWGVRGRGRFDFRRRGPGEDGLLARLTAVSLDLTILAIGVLLAVNASYRFQRSGWAVHEILRAPEPQSWINKELEQDKLIAPDGPRPSLLTALPARARVPAPFPYIHGLALVRAQNARSHGGYFWFGEREPGPLYFPVMLMIKTPVGVLVLLGIGGALALRRRRRPSSATIILTLFGAAFLGLACSARIQIGVRHVLPLLPIAGALAGRAAVLAWEEGRPLLRAAVALAVAGTILSTVASYPRYLGYFNALTLGSRYGLEVSIIGEDWGQDVRALAEDVRAHAREPLFYATEDALRRHELQHWGVEARGMRCRQPPSEPGWIALHRATLARSDPRCYGWIDRDKPDVVVADHILLWRWRAGARVNPRRERDAGSRV